MGAQTPVSAQGSCLSFCRLPVSGLTRGTSTRDRIFGVLAPVPTGVRSRGRRSVCLSAAPRGAGATAADACAPRPARGAQRVRVRLQRDRHVPYSGALPVRAYAVHLDRHRHPITRPQGRAPARPPASRSASRARFSACRNPTAVAQSSTCDRHVVQPTAWSRYALHTASDASGAPLTASSPTCSTTARHPSCDASQLPLTARPFRSATPRS